MQRDLPTPERRKPLTRLQFATLILEQDGRCGCCGDRLQADKIVDEHLVPLDQMGSNDLENRSLWCKPCATEKTTRDLKASAKGRRLRGETGNGRKASIPQPRISPLSKKHPGYIKPKFQKRGFAAR